MQSKIYEEMGLSKAVSRFGLSSNFLHSMFNEFNLFDESLPQICKKAGDMKVTEFMYKPTEGEYVDDTATLSMAIHQLVMGHHQSLLVIREVNIIGILRLTDVFMEVSRMVTK